MNTDRLRQYASLKKQIALLEAEAELMRETVLADVKDFVLENDGNYPEVPGVGKFNVKTSKVWQYSEGYKVAEESLKRMKKEEQQTGLATYEEKEILEFRIEQDVA